MAKGRKIFEITKQIIKWIWRVILSLFFILLIILQAPLKVLALIAIFLLPSTVLPLRYCKWFWITAGIIILGLVLWIFLPESDEGWKPFTFSEELAALEAKREIPDGENAAVIYNQLLADYNKTDFELNCLDDEFADCEISKTFWRSKDYPEVAKWINSNKQTINKLIQASNFEKCKFDVTMKSPLVLEMERLVAFRQWAILLLRAANNDIAEGRIDGGLKKYYCTLQMGRHQFQQSFFVEILVGISLKTLATNRLNDFVVTGNPSKKQLDAIKGVINEVKYDWQSDLPRVLDYEKLLFKNMLGLFYEVNAKEQYRFTRNPGNMIKFLSPEFKIPPQNYLQKKHAKAYNIIYWFFAPATPQELSKTIDAAYRKTYEMADPNFDWNREPPEVKFSWLSFKLNYKYFVEMLSYILEPSYYNIHDLYLRSDSGKKGALLLIAMRRYKNKNGVWPENLDEIADLTNEENFIDPANGQSFVYKLANNNFILYSKGKNGIDNGGQPYSCERDKNNDDINIWPLKQCQKESPKKASGEPNDTQRD